MQKTPPSSWASAARPILLTALAMMVAGIGMGGCIDPSACNPREEANPAQPYLDGTTANGVYQSSPRWDYGFLPFPGGKRYDLAHSLGTTPVDVRVYLAFRPDPQEPVALCAGDSCLVTANEQRIQVRNSTCTEFWIRVVAWTPMAPSIDAGAAAYVGDAAVEANSLAD